LRGERAAAVSLCERQMWWQHRLSRRAGDAGIARRSVQPWVNLARLEAIAGEWEAALSRLQRLRPHGRTGAIALQPVRSDGMGCQHIAQDGGAFSRVVENIYVVDTLRALLQNRRFDEVLGFSEQVHRAFRPFLGLWALEASMVAASSLGDAELARRLGGDALQREEVTAWRRMLFRLRLAEVEACAGDLARAREALGPLVRAEARLSREARSPLQSLYILARLASACLEAGLLPEAAAVARGVYDGARTAGDEVFQVEALRTLAAAAPPGETAAWEEALRALEASTEYRQYRSRQAPPPDPAAFDALCAELAEVYAS
ncbi:MAG TPA: hypothetical protein VGX50_09170, partial [Longimicrobium sp.]|nr:hypothetical protein [Longimicrobium sp.]